MLNKRLSTLAIIIVAITCVWNSLNEKRWNDWGVIVWDAACYYGYLPKVFNHKDDTLTKDEQRIQGLAPGNKYVVAPNGKKVLKTTMGMAVLYLPFYAAGYLLHYIRYGYAGTGMEVEYRMAMQFFATFYLLVALVLIRKLLQRYFHDGVVAATILVVALGTNAWYYTVYEGTMAHVPNMALFLAFFFCMERWFTKASIKWSVLLGLVAGLMVLIRPTNVLIGIFFLLAGVWNWDTTRERFLLLLHRWKYLLLIAVFAALVWVPQVVYWYRLTGHFYFYAYYGEYFYFSHPNIYNGLLGWRKGWLIYTPVGVLMLAGFVVMYRYAKSLLLPAVLFYVCYTWVIYSWWCWWYGGSFSSRPMVEAYAILALPLASLFQFVFIDMRWKPVKAAFGLLLAMLISLNLYQTWQAKKGIIHYQNMTYDAYKTVFLRAHAAPDNMLMEPDWTSAARGWPTK